MKDIKDQCTTLEQSKKLKELGFTKDTASLMWEGYYRINKNEIEHWGICFAGGMHPATINPTLPCWTCADMMEIINDVVYTFKNKNGATLNISYSKDTIYLKEVSSCGLTLMGTIIEMGSLRDNLFECIVCLKNNKYL